MHSEARTAGARGTVTLLFTDMEGSTRLVALSRALRALTGAPATRRGPDLEQVAALARESLGAEAAARPYSEGGRLELEQVQVQQLAAW